MNYYQARQRREDSRWDYTSMNDGHVRPVGYCTGWRELSEKTIAMVYPGGRDNPSFRKDEEERAKFREKYHADGHATAEEACACYKEYVLDRRLHERTMSGQQLKCEVCDTWTQMTLEVDHRMFVLCDEHRTREEVAKLFEVGEAISSY